MPEVKLSEFVTLVELSELYTGSLVRLPIIKGSQKQGDAPLPAVVTVERGTGHLGRKGRRIAPYRRTRDNCTTWTVDSYHGREAD